MNRNLILLKNLLLSTSQINILKHSTDKKKKGRVVGNIIGLVILYAMLMAYSIAMCVGYGEYGLTDSVPVLCAIIISALAFVFTFMKTNGYLFNFKEYDMLMSLPFEARSVAACKFLYMYVKTLPWFASISVSTMIGYGMYAKPGFFVYVLWVILSLILPIIPMVAAAFLGFIIARISAGFKKSNVVQTVLMFALVILAFSVRFFMEDIFRNDKVEETLNATSEIMENAGGKYLPAKWFSDAITKCDILGILLLCGVSILLFAAVFYVVGNSYRNINSALKSHAAAKNYKMKSQKKSSIVNAIAFKEFKRMTGSTIYMVNGATGEILCFVLGLATLIVGFDRIVAMITHNAPFDYAVIQPAIPFIVYFFIGMVPTTAISPSIEGKNYWIVQSLPISKTTLYNGKMLFNMYLTVPFTIFANLCMCISAGVPVVDTIMYILLGIVLCAFSSAWGCVCGIRFMRLDWENEVEVIKQGAAVAISMFPNMFAVMALCALSIFLGFSVGHVLLALIFIIIAAGLAAICYFRAMKLAKKSF